MGLSGETLEKQRRPAKHWTLANLSGQAVRARRGGVSDLLAQRVGPCFTLEGHTARGLTQTGCVCFRSETLLHTVGLPYNFRRVVGLIPDPLHTHC